MTPLRLMLDSMVFDQIAEDDGLRLALARRVDEGTADLLITHIQADQLASIPDEGRRKRLIAAAFSLGLRSVPTAVFVLGLSRLGMARLSGLEAARQYDELRTGWRDGADAAIGVSAGDYGAILVTSDERYGRRMRRVIPDVPVWSIDDLRAFAYSSVIPDGTATRPR